MSYSWSQEIVTSFGITGSRLKSYDSSYKAVSPLVKFNNSGNYYNNFKLLGELDEVSNFGILIKNVLYYNRLRAHANFGFGLHMYDYNFRLYSLGNLNPEDQPEWASSTVAFPYHTYSNSSVGAYYGKMDIGGGFAVARLKSWEFSLLLGYSLEVRSQSSVPVAEDLGSPFQVYDYNSAAIKTLAQYATAGWAMRRNSWELEVYSILGLSQQGLESGTFQYKLVGGGASLTKVLKVNKLAPDQYINDDYAIAKTTVNKTFRQGKAMWYYEATESQRDFEVLDLNNIVIDSFEVRGYGDIKTAYDRLLIRKTLKGSFGYAKFFSNRLALGVEFTSYEEEIYGRGIAGDENNNYIGNIAPLNPNDFKNGLFKSKKYSNSSINFGLNSMIYIFDNEKIIDPFVQGTYSRIRTPNHSYGTIDHISAPELRARPESLNYFNAGIGADLRLRLRGTTYLNFSLISEYVVTPVNNYFQGSFRTGIYFKKNKDKSNKKARKNEPSD